MADTLYWLMQRYDESADVDDDISTESDRVVFLKAVAQVGRRHVTGGAERRREGSGCLESCFEAFEALEPPRPVNSYPFHPLPRPARPDPRLPRRRHRRRCSSPRRA